MSSHGLEMRWYSSRFDSRKRRFMGPCGEFGTFSLSLGVSMQMEREMTWRPVGVPRGWCRNAPFSTRGMHRSQHGSRSDLPLIILDSVIIQTFIWCYVYLPRTHLQLHWCPQSPSGQFLSQERLPARPLWIHNHTHTDGRYGNPTITSIMIVCCGRLARWLGGWPSSVRFIL